MDQYSNQVQPGPVLPEGRSLIDTVKLGLAMKGHTEDTAAKLGVNKETYRLTRKLLILKERSDVMEADKQIIDKAFFYINHGKPGQARKVSYEVLEKYWTKRTFNGTPLGRSRSERNFKAKRKLNRLEEKKRKRLESTLFAIREACCNNEELEMPCSFSDKEVRDHLETLVDSMAALAVLAQKMKGEAK